jgi:ADP-ribose pyrophosphatase
MRPAPRRRPRASLSMAARIRAWSLVREVQRVDYRIFQIRSLEVEDPRNGALYPRVVLEATDWVNVVAITKGGDAVLVRQFRFGTWSDTLEIPGGMVDGGETPEAAAMRELEEETGYRAGRVVPLGFSHPNPAIFGNRLHSFLALDCEQVHGGAPEASEDIAVELVPRTELAALVKRGEISHSLVLAALYLEGLEAGSR